MLCGTSTTDTHPESNFLHTSLHERRKALKPELTGNSAKLEVRDIGSFGPTVPHFTCHFTSRLCEFFYLKNYLSKNRKQATDIEEKIFSDSFSPY